jgi:hypothetical protein
VREGKTTSPREGASTRSQYEAANRISESRIGKPNEQWKMLGESRWLKAKDAGKRQLKIKRIKPLTRFFRLWPRLVPR